MEAIVRNSGKLRTLDKVFNEFKILMKHSPGKIVGVGNPPVGSRAGATVDGKTRLGDGTIIG
jgi:hypothetical protein